MASGFQANATSGRFKTTGLSKSLANSDSSRKVFDSIKRLKAARSRNPASSSFIDTDIHCSYNSSGHRITKTPRRKSRRKAVTIITPGILRSLPFSLG